MSKLQSDPSVSALSDASPAEALSYRPVSLDDYEKLARERLSHIAWEYYNSGSADELTIRWNRESLQRIRLKPNVLVDVSSIDTSVTLLGKELPHPILLAPTSTHAFAHPDAEIETMRGASAANAAMVISTMSNRSVEEIAAVATGPFWFQLYVGDDRGRTRELIERAEAAGGGALCITVDNAAHYARNRIDRSLQNGIPQVYFPHVDATAGPGGIGRAPGRSRRFGWKELEWIQSFARTPIVLKGILSADDGEVAVKAGMAAVVVSNHGGRTLDSIPASIDALQPMVERIAGRIPVLVDGGFRRGTDVLKGLAYGATAVLIGRPYLYGLAVSGADGVRDVVNILRTEFEAAMALTGRTSLAAIDRSVIW